MEPNWAWTHLPLRAPTRVRELRCLWKACPKSRNWTPFTWTWLRSSGKDWMTTFAPRSLDPSIFSLLEYKQLCKLPERQWSRGHPNQAQDTSREFFSLKVTDNTKDKPFLRISLIILLPIDFDFPLWIIN